MRLALSNLAKHAKISLFVLVFMQPTPPIHPIRARQRLGRRFYQYYSWFLLAMVLAGVALDKIMAVSFWAKGFVLGAVLGYIAQSLFFWLNHRSHSPIASMSAMYLAVVVKWLVALVGFVWIFWTVQGVSGMAVILGFFVMHMAMVFLVQYLVAKL